MIIIFGAMDKQRKLLASLNFAAALVCLFFFIFLLKVGHPENIGYFALAAVMFFTNIYFVKLGKYTLAYVVFALSSNSLMLMFDGGYLHPTKSFVFYFPLLLSNYMLTRANQVKERIAVIVFTCCCIALTNFTTLTPRLSDLLYDASQANMVAVFNITVAVAASMFVIRTVIDVNKYTEQQLKTEQEKLEASQHLVNSITQNIDVGICRTHVAADNFIYINRAQVSMFGYESEEEMMLIPPVSLYAYESDRKWVVEELERKGAVVNLEMEFRRKNGSTFWGLMSTNRLVDTSGNIMYDGVVRDITALNEMKQELIVAKDQAEQSSMAKSKFLSAMSHEIRTPMNAVIGITNLLLVTDRDNEVEKENLKVLKNSAENLMNLLNDLLDFGKIEAGKIELHEEYVSIREQIDQLMGMYSFRAKEKKIDFVSKVLLNDEQYLMDGVRFSQVISNLLSNAIKFTDNGYVKLTVQRLSQQDDRDTLLFQVEDSGIGIDPAQQAAIFGAFTQESPGILKKFGGSGLGLAISRRILEMMNSKVSVQSEKGRGAVFSFMLTLPKKISVSASRPGLLLTDQQGALSGVEILLAEDNLINISVARQMLERWGISVDVARNGKEVLEHLKDKSYQLILMDLHMPEMDGFEATRRIRAGGNMVPIIALTADALAETRTQSFEMGMDDFITKPFNPAELYQKLSAYLLPEASESR